MLQNQTIEEYKPSELELWMLDVLFEMILKGAENEAVNNSIYSL